MAQQAASKIASINFHFSKIFGITIPGLLNREYTENIFFKSREILIYGRTGAYHALGEAVVAYATRNVTPFFLNHCIRYRRDQIRISK